MLLRHIGNVQDFAVSVYRMDQVLRIVLLLSAVLAAGCTPPSTSPMTPPSTSIGDTVRVCNSSGCTVQPTGMENRRTGEAPSEPPGDPDAYRGEKVADLQAEARRGDPVANYKLGLVHAYGLQGGRADLPRAVGYFRAAAEAGHAGGQYRLGQMYAAGQGVAKRQAEALRLFTTAAEAGHPGAAYELGMMLVEGVGVPRDPQGGARWLETAADAGIPRAQLNLGLLYFRGTGVRQDGHLAMSWMRRAAESGEVEAQTALGKLYLTGYDTVGQDLNEADRWLSAAAGQGSGEAEKALDELRQIRADDTAFQRELTQRRAENRRWLFATPLRFRPGLPTAYGTGWQ